MPSETRKILRLRSERRVMLHAAQDVEQARQVAKKHGIEYDNSVVDLIYLLKQAAAKLEEQDR